MRATIALPTEEGNVKKLVLSAFAVAVLAALAGLVGAAKAPSAVRAGVNCSSSATIAYFGPTTGPVASIGAELRGFSLLYAQQWNAAGKKPTMKIEEGDTKFDPAVTSTIAQRFASDSNVLGVIGPGASQEVLAAGPIFKKAAMPFVAASATRTSLTNGSLPTFLRIAAPDKIQAVSTAQFIKTKLKGKSVFAVDDQSAYGKPLADQVSSLLRGLGVKVTRASVTAKTSDFSSVITSMPSGTNVVYMAMQIPQKMTLFGTQLKEQGKNPKIMLSDAGGSGVTLTGLVYYSTFGPDITRYPPAKPVLKAYYAKYGAKAPVTAFGPLAYVSGQVVVDAVARACKDGTATRAEVLKQLHQTHLTTSVFGDPISFNSHGDRIGAHFFQFQLTKKGPVPVR
jgi:branched-chain amino acid transport system substrate-binding protein